MCVYICILCLIQLCFQNLSGFITIAPKSQLANLSLAYSYNYIGNVLDIFLTDPLTFTKK